MESDESRRRVLAAAVMLGLLLLPVAAGIPTAASRQNLTPAPSQQQQQATNAAVRPPPARYISARTFGAIPNDGKDDTLALRAALGNCSKGGGAVYIPPGNYTVSKLTVASSVTILPIPSHCHVFGATTPPTGPPSPLRRRAGPTVKASTGSTAAGGGEVETKRMDGKTAEQTIAEAITANVTRMVREEVRAEIRGEMVAEMQRQLAEHLKHMATMLGKEVPG